MEENFAVIIPQQRPCGIYLKKWALTKFKTYLVHGANAVCNARKGMARLNGEDSVVLK